MFGKHKNKVAKALVIGLIGFVVVPASGCRTGIRRVANAIEGQGATEFKYEETSEKTLVNYLTSENSSLQASGVELEIDPASKNYKVKINNISMIRTPSENQQYFAQQWAQGRAADTQAIAGYAQITGAVVESAVQAAVQAVVPIAVNRQDNKTARTQIRADRDVSLATVEAAHAGGEHSGGDVEGGGE